jgi:hypothetical protein
MRVHGRFLESVGPDERADGAVFEGATALAGQ